MEIIIERPDRLKIKSFRIRPKGWVTKLIWLIISLEADLEFEDLNEIQC